MTKYKYSKSSDFYKETKKDFFSKNSKFLKKVESFNEIYSSQPLRTNCKLCKSKLPKKEDFFSHNIAYKFCQSCSHLNGGFEETEEFVKSLYLSEEAEYSKNYIDKDFIKRSQDIYMPKVDFLIESINLANFEVLDVGCGSGYFVYSCILKKIKAKGIDVNKDMVDFGNKQILHQIKCEPLSYVDEKTFYDSICNTKAQVITAIGVIEHLRDLDLFLEAFKKSKASYLFYSVPMFSFSAIIESIFEEVFPRQLGGAHTHLFTEDSIKKMHKILKVNSISEWRFGTDFMDLYRSINTMLLKKKTSESLQKFLDKGFFSTIDSFQSLLDEKHFCSEIHCLVSKK